MVVPWEYYISITLDPFYMGVPPPPPRALLSIEYEYEYFSKCLISLVAENREAVVKSSSTVF